MGVRDDEEISARAVSIPGLVGSAQIMDIRPSDVNANGYYDLLADIDAQM